MTKPIIKNNSLKVSVSQLENKNQFLIEYLENNNRVICFQSYKTLIAVYKPSENQLYINYRYFDYSKTTSKHLKIFINEYTKYNYYNLKQFTQFILSCDEVILFE